MGIPPLRPVFFSTWIRIKDRTMENFAQTAGTDSRKEAPAGHDFRTWLREASSLQFITHYTDRYSYHDSAIMALEGGCRWIQLRMKDSEDAEIERVAKILLPECRSRGAVLVIDDRLDVALRIGADGVHLGKNDMPVSQARSIAGNGFIIGGTANTFDDICALYRQGADYIGCGPFRFTTTKKNLATILGLDGYRRLTEQMKENGISLPIVAIGGITYDDIPEIMKTGVTGIALSGSILRADDPVAEMRRTVEATVRYTCKEND